MTKLYRCVGYGAHEKICKNKPYQHSDYWCERCDKIRRDSITASLKDILTGGLGGIVVKEKTNDKE